MMAACCLNLYSCHPEPQDRPGVVTFSLNGSGGVPVREAVRGTQIDQPYDDVTVEFQEAHISLSLHWGGYESDLLQKTRHSLIENMVDERPTTRQELAEQVCFLFIHFHKMASKLRISNNHRTLGLGEDDIRVTDVVLYSVHYCRHTNTWVPHFGIVDRAGLERHN
ncbi:hypothetical protein EDC04DRAFT_256663 [Pisolithus marmoratus]|nr:hypothetical protein EDC04DRAFT_256663 [Pisolithus marmoratus]